jgi:hypothetical protein
MTTSKRWLLGIMKPYLGAASQSDRQLWRGPDWVVERVQGTGQNCGAGKRIWFIFITGSQQ